MITEWEESYMPRTRRATKEEFRRQNFELFQSDSDNLTAIQVYLKETTQTGTIRRTLAEMRRIVDAIKDGSRVVVIKPDGTQILILNQPF